MINKLKIYMSYLFCNSLFIMKFLHRFKNSLNHDNLYNSHDYKEPWVGYTTDKSIDVSYNIKGDYLTVTTAILKNLGQSSGKGYCYIFNYYYRQSSCRCSSILLYNDYTGLEHEIVATFKETDITAEEPRLTETMNYKTFELPSWLTINDDIRIVGNTSFFSNKFRVHFNDGSDRYDYFVDMDKLEATYHEGTYTSYIIWYHDGIWQYYIKGSISGALF